MANRKNTLLIKRSNISGNVPTAGQILLGELALNTADVILYASGTTTNSILPIGWDRVARSGDTMIGTLFTPYLSATTVSATTYLNLPIDPDTFVTGGTYITSAGTLTFTNNTGGTFNVTGLTSSDTFVTGYTYSNNIFTIARNQGLPNLTALINTMTGLTINGNFSVTGNTTSGSLSATSISSTTLTVSGVTFNKLLKEKVGSVAGTSFTGNPKTYSVVFGTNFTNTNYAVFLTGTENRTYTYESQTVSGFTINVHANAPLTGNVYWMAKQIGEV